MNRLGAVDIGQVYSGILLNSLNPNVAVNYHVHVVLFNSTLKFCVFFFVYA